MRRSVVGLVVGVLVLGLFLLVVDVGRVLAVLARADGSPLALAVVVAALGVGLLAESFRVVRGALEPGGRGAGRRFYLAYASAYFVRLVIPVGSSGAPAINAYVIGQEFEAPFEAELAVATAAELLRYGTSAAVGLVGLVLFVVAGGRVAHVGIVLAAITAILLVAGGLLGTLAYRPGAIDRVVLAVAAALDATLGRLSVGVHRAVRREQVADRLDTFRRSASLLGEAPTSMLAATLLAAGSWLGLSFPLFLAFHALGEPIPLALALFVVPVSGFAYALPVSGGLGGVELVIGTLVVAGTGADLAVTAAAVLLFRLVTFWLPLAVGGLVTAARPVDLPIEGW